MLHDYLACCLQVIFLLQVLEYNTPEKLLLNEESAFSKMVQSTGAANAQYLRSLVHRVEEENSSTGDNNRLDGQRRWLASSRWAAAAQFALAVSLTSSQNDLQHLEIEDEDNILKKTKDAVITLQGVLEGKHDKAIEETLEQYQVPTDRWWSSLYRVVEGKSFSFYTPYILLSLSVNIQKLKVCPFTSSRFNYLPTIMLYPSFN